jgi:CRISPR/Cas system-associated exonuclease Cas4 (RecB family)
MGLITAWSYSRWETYETCPLMAKYKFVVKLPTEESPAMQRGKRAHTDIAAYLRCDIPLENPYSTAPLIGWTYFGALLNELRALEPLVEQEWGFTSKWAPTGWFGKDTWFRSVLDAAVVYDDGSADVVDMKTGKRKPEHARQAELYAVSIMVRYPAVQRVTSRFWYLDTGDEAVYRFARSNLAELIAKWTAKVKPLLTDTLMVPRPGRHCNWCDFSKSKGGPCKYG